MLEPIGSALSYLAQPTYWLAMAAALGLAIMAGVIPGVNSFLVMALAIPFIVLNIESPAIGLVMLATITGVDNTLDSIPAILYGQPGAATQVTFLEGHQLARQGKAAHTLGAVYAVSALGGIIGAIALTIAIPVIRPFVLKFGFPEIAAMGLVGVGMVSILSRGAMRKGLIAAGIGMLMATIGKDPFTGTSRLTLGPLFSLPLVPVALGLFAMPEMIDLTMTRRAVAPAGADVSTARVFEGAREGLRHWRMVIRQSLFGVFLGAIPGVGSAVIDWLSYAFGIFFSKDKSQFGKGSLEGVMFAESAQNAKEGGQAIPTLAMGVPGGPTWVLVMAGMLAYGVAPGPQMLGHHADITILLVITLALGNLAITGIGLLVTGQLAKLTTIPYPVIGAIIIPILFLTAFIETFSWRGIQVVFVVAAMGLVMKQYHWPRPPMLLGFILAPIIEMNYQSGLSIDGAWGILQRPVTMTIVGVAVVTAVLFLRAIRKVEQEQEELLEADSVSDGTAMDELPGDKPWFHRLQWRWEHLVPLAILIVASWAAIEASGYPDRAQPFPLWISVSVAVLAAIQLFDQATHPERLHDVMDLSMTSTHLEGAGRTALVMMGLLAMFLLIGTTVGMKWGAVAFGAAVPIVFLGGLGRWPLAALTSGLVYLFVYVVLDNVLFILWPEPFIGNWLAEHVF